MESFNHTMTTIGRAVKLAEDGLSTSQADLMIATKEWLESPRSGGWILIVDGTNNSAPGFIGYIEQFLPHRRGTIVFTSTTAQIIHTVGSPDMAVEIGPMDSTDASELFKKVSGLDVDNQAQIGDLLEHLGHLPLAITQAASYIRARAFTVGNYLDLMRSAEDEVRGLMFDASSADPHDYTAAVSRSVMTTWKVTLDHIVQINPEAIALLNFMSLLGPNIPITVLKPFKKASRMLSTDVAFHDAIGLLISYCLLVPSHSNHFSGKTYRLHRLAGMRARISMGSQKQHVVGTALDAIKSQFPYPKPQESNTVKCSGLLQHAEAVLKHSSDFEELESVRNQLKSKVELHRFYAYEYKKNKFSMLAARSLHRKAPTGTDDPQALLHQGPTMPAGLDYDLRLGA